jgi:O-antigen ligase
MSTSHYERSVSTIASKSIPKLWLATLYTGCLIPLSIEGFGVNYLFVFIPFVYLLSGRAMIRPRAYVAFYIYAGIAVFLLASIYQIDWIEYFDRRIISLFLYLTMFALCFVPITEGHISAFKLSILIVGLIFSLKSILMFISMGAEAQAFESKDIVGSQRYGFVFILSYWILWYDKESINSRLFRVICLTTLALGIALTFSRASLVAFVASGAFAFLFSMVSGGVSVGKWLKKFAFGLVVLTFGLFAVYLVAPIIFEFFFVRLIEYVLLGRASDAIADPETSDGTRLFIWYNILEFVMHNPLTGSGFLGVWVLNLYGGFTGSSHSQYFDALFRMGPFLFMGYIYFLLKVLHYFNKSDYGIFIGFIGILIYGLFHETFKESHGMFILAMLIATSQRRRASTIKYDKNR